MDKNKTTAQIKDYVLLMLGAPITKIELEDQQLELCVTETYSVFEKQTNQVLNDEFELTPEAIALLQEGALTHAKIILGRIRSKFANYATQFGGKLDGKTLLKEGMRDHKAWKLKFLDYLPDYKTFEKTQMTTEETETPEKDVRGLLVIYVNVGTLPPFKAEAFVARMKDQNKMDAVKKHCEIIYIPVRDRATEVQYIPFNK